MAAKPKTAGVLLLAALVALISQAQMVHSQVAVPCEGLTRVPYCTECAKPAGATTPLCYLCYPSRASVWRTDGTGTVSQVGMTRSRGNKGAANQQVPAQVSRHWQLPPPCAPLHGH